MFATGDFQEISLNNWIRRIPPEMAKAHLNLDADDVNKIWSEAGIYIIPG
jgi:oxalate decarboxylase